jgi:hypothetical protein
MISMIRLRLTGAKICIIVNKMLAVCVLGMFRNSKQCLTKNVGALLHSVYKLYVTTL